MRSCLAILVALFCAGICAAQKPASPAGNEWPPVIGAWFWKDETLDPDGYKPFLDAAAAHAPYTLLSTSLRVSKGEVTDSFIRDQIGKAVHYAKARGLKIAFDSTSGWLAARSAPVTPMNCRRNWFLKP